MELPGGASRRQRKQQKMIQGPARRIAGFSTWSLRGIPPRCRSKISFACKEQEIKAALEPHVSEDLLYASLGGSKPDESYSFDRLDTLMRSLDKVHTSCHSFLRR